MDHYTPEQAKAVGAALQAAIEHRPQTTSEQLALREAFGGIVPTPWDLVCDPDQSTFRRSGPVEITDEMIERGACALINADALEPYDRTDGRWRPAVLVEAIIRAALS